MVGVVAQSGRPPEAGEACLVHWASSPAHAGDVWRRCGRCPHRLTVSVFVGPGCWRARARLQALCRGAHSGTLLSLTVRGPMCQAPPPCQTRLSAAAASAAAWRAWRSLTNRCCGLAAMHLHGPPGAFCVRTTRTDVEECRLWAPSMRDVHMGHFQHAHPCKPTHHQGTCPHLLTGWYECTWQPYGCWYHYRTKTLRGSCWHLLAGGPTLRP